MKSKYLFAFILLLLFCGCSSTYHLKDYTSKNKFIEDVNSSIENRDFNIHLINDSLFSVAGGGKITNDTLVSSSLAVPLSNIKQVEYKTRWRSGITGALGGTLLSLLTGALIANGTHGEGDNYNWVFLIYFAPIVGVLTGGTAGALIGWNTVYLFDN